MNAVRSIAIRGMISTRVSHAMSSSSKGVTDVRSDGGRDMTLLALSEDERRDSHVIRAYLLSATLNISSCTESRSK